MRRNTLSASVCISTIALTILYAPPARADSSTFCDIAASTAIDVENKYESLDQYENIYDALKYISSQSETESSFEETAKNQGLGASYKLVKLFYNNSKGRSASAATHREIFSSLDRKDFAQSMLSSATNSEKRTFVREMIPVFQECARNRPFTAQGFIEESPSIVRLALRTTAVGGGPRVAKITAVPKNNIVCDGLIGQRVGPDGFTVSCERKRNEHTNITVFLERHGTDSSRIQTVRYPNVQLVSNTTSG